MHAFAQDEEGEIDRKVGMQRCAGRPLHAMFGPESLVTVMEAFGVERLGAFVARRERGVGRRDANPG